MMTIGLTFALLSLAAPQPDFHVRFNGCKTLLTAFDERADLVTSTAEPFAWACRRSGTRVTCDLVSDRDMKPTRDDFEVTADTPPLLMMNSKAGVEHMLIDTAQRVAVSTTRIVHVVKDGPTLYGSKVCKGYFLTQAERERLKTQ